MTDPTPNAPMPTPLSPAAQAVMDAWVENTQYAPIDNEPLSLAAALRSVADQVVPDIRAFISPGTAAGIRDDILAIATELEGHQ
jgi:hypothetical protein